MRYAVCLILMLFVYQIPYAQDFHNVAEDHATLLEKIKENPADYTSQERAEAYLTFISSFSMANMDTIIPMHRQMVAWGLEIEDDEVVIEGYSAIVFMHSYQNENDSCFYYLEKMRPHVTKPFLRATFTGNLGEEYVKANMLDSAEVYLQESLDIIRQRNSVYLYPTALLRMSILLRKQHKYRSALKYTLEAMEKSAAVGMQSKKANSLQNISDLYHLIDDDKRALDYINQAIAIVKEKGHTRSIARFTLKRASICKSQGRYLEAIMDYKSAIPTLKERDLDQQLMIAYSDLASAYLSVNEVDSASYYLQLARPITAIVNDSARLASFLITQGRRDLQLGKYNEARASYESVLDIGESTDRLTNQVTALEGLKRVAIKQNRWKDAIAYADSSIARQAINDIKEQKTLLYDLEYLHGTELKDAEISQLSKDRVIQEQILLRRNRQLLWAMIGLLSLCVAGYLVYRAYKAKERLAADLQSALDTNKMLIKEIHHRVKNNLQVVASLLNIQSHFEKNDKVLRAINAGKYRVQSMTILHQKLYINEDLMNVSIKDYFVDMITAIVSGYPIDKEIQLDLSIQDIEMDVDTLIPLGLIANELVTNAMKYAYKENSKAYTLSFQISNSDGMTRMAIRDNGVGLPFDSIPEDPETMGMQLVQSFAKKLKADISIDNFAGSEIKITFAHQQNRPSINVAS